MVYRNLLAKFGTLAFVITEIDAFIQTNRQRDGQTDRHGLMDSTYYPEHEYMYFVV